MVDFTMPSLGADMEAATLVEWLVEPGARVHKGDIVAVVETDKGAIDVEIFQEGTVEELLVQPVARVAVGAPLARLRVEGETEAEPEAEAAPEAEAPPPVPAEKMSPPSPTTQRAVLSRVAASPRARRLATTLGVELEKVVGTGPRGAVTAEDVQRAAEAAEPLEASAEPSPKLEKKVAMRKAIAAAMSRSNREIPHYYLGTSIDLEPALQWLERTNADRPISERILAVALLVRAVARALEKYPTLCGWWRDDEFVPSAHVHVGLAVSLREDGGLINPAIHDANRGSLDELMTKIRDVTQRARAGQLRSSELGDAAITVTNLGDQGVPTVFGVIHPPQVALVGIGAITTRPWVVDGAVVARRVVDVSLAADHRVSDGHLGARFLRRVAKVLEAPESS
jgi:pyruvate dehydrogenase E2 component (dihydrolipoamide acetyltransferase)